MTVADQLATLTQLAQVMGYEVQNTAGQGQLARLNRGGSRPRLSLAQAPPEQLLPAVARCLQNDPELAWLDLDEDQEQALRAGSRRAQDSIQMLSVPTSTPADFQWPEATHRRAS